MVYSVIIYIYNNIVKHKVLEPISAGLNCIIFGMEQERTIGGERKKKEKKNKKNSCCKILRDLLM